jgi:hypothetical protein
MSSIPSVLPIPKVGDALTRDGVALTQELAEHSDKFFAEFDWYMAALRAGRELSDPRKVKS